MRDVRSMALLPAASAASTLHKIKYTSVSRKRKLGLLMALPIAKTRSHPRARHPPIEPRAKTR